MRRASDSDFAKARVHIGGAGRVGSAIALALHASGVRYISCNDPQLFEEEQLGCLAFSRRSDLGRAKVNVLERFFDGRPGIVFEGVVAPNESRKIAPLLERADVVVCAANRLPARLHLERAAIALRTPVVQASVQDGRREAGGLVSVWTPDADCACFGCLFPQPDARFPRGEILPPTVTSLIGILAAHRVVALLRSRRCVPEPNLTFVDLTRCSLEAISLKPRPGCQICGDFRKSAFGSRRSEVVSRKLRHVMRTGK